MTAFGFHCAVATAVVGITASDADATLLNEPVLDYHVQSAIAKAGKAHAGCITQAIADQSKPVTVVVRVSRMEPAMTRKLRSHRLLQISEVRDENGKYTGIKALLTAQVPSPASSRVFLSGADTKECRGRACVGCHY